MLNDQEITALVIQHKVKKGSEKLYEEWSAKILEHVKESPGYVGREIFPPAKVGEPYNVIVRFESQKDVRTWLDSPERKESIESIRDLLEEGDKKEIKAGIDVWFTPTNASSKPRPYKQFLITTAVIYPLTLIIPRLLSPLFEISPAFENELLKGFIVTVIIVALMTYLIMPRLTSWLKDWLTDKDGTAKSKHEAKILRGKTNDFSNGSHRKRR